MLIDINKSFLFTKENMTLHVSEKDIKFATTYQLRNPKTNQAKVFNFVKSTGAEFDPNTVWIYKTEDNSLTLKVYNERVTTVINAGNYLKAKLR